MNSILYHAKSCLMPGSVGTVEGLAHVYKDPDFREKVRPMAKEYRGK